MDKSTVSQIEQYVNEHFEKSFLPGLSSIETFDVK